MYIYVSYSCNPTSPIDFYLVAAASFEHQLLFHVGLSGSSISMFLASLLINEWIWVQHGATYTKIVMCPTPRPG